MTLRELMKTEIGEKISGLITLGSWIGRHHENFNKYLDWYVDKVEFRGNTAFENEICIAFIFKTDLSEIGELKKNGKVEII